MPRLFALAFVCAAPAVAQIPHGHLIYAHRNPSATVAAIGIVDPDHGTQTPLVPATGSLAAHGSRTVAIDPAAPTTLYSVTSLSVSIAASIPMLGLTGNVFTRTNLQVNLGAPGLPFHLRWATGHGLLMLGRGGQINRMFLRDQNTGVVISQPTTTLLPNMASDMAFLGGKAYATSEGDGSATAVGTLIEWDLAANTDRVVGTNYPPLTSLAVFAGQLIAGDPQGNLHLIDATTGAISPFLTTGLGKIVSLAVDANSRVFVLAENAGTWSIHNAFTLQPALYSSNQAIEDLEVGPAPVPTMLTFGNGCAGSNSLAPVLGFVSAPSLGGSFDVTLTGAPGNTVAILAAGSSRVAAGTTPLPADLTPLGMPGCTQYTDVIATLLAPVGAAGTAQRTFSLPANPAFAGVRIPMQWVVLDPQANALGATTSSGGEAYVY